MLREIGISADSRIAERFRGGFVREFESEASCIAELYLFLIRDKVKTDKTRKVLLFFTDLQTGPPPEVRPIRCLWPFDFSDYIAADAREKKQRVLDALHAGMLWLAENCGWAPQPLEDAYVEAVARDLTLKASLKKTWPSPDRRYRVRVDFRFDIDAVYLDAVLTKYHGSQEVARLKLGKARPYRGCMFDYGAEGEWTAPTVFELRSTSFIKEKWTVDFSNAIAGDAYGSQNDAR
ncbi:MAG: hypothetical protein KDA47_21335 [Planctomycetales bacterium]|nr:hypothetical protein [Planctomycetales bacterium]